MFGIIVTIAAIATLIHIARDEARAARSIES